MSTAVVAAAVASQQVAVVAAGAAQAKPAVVQTPGPCPPAEESLAAWVALGLIEVVGPARPGEGKPFQYRALFRGRTGPHDDGRVS